MIKTPINQVRMTNVAVVREQSPFAGTQLATSGSFAQSFLDTWSGEGTQLTYAGGSPSARDQKVLEASAGVADGTYDAILVVGPTSDAQAALATAQRKVFLQSIAAKESQRASLIETLSGVR